MSSPIYYLLISHLSAFIAGILIHRLYILIKIRRGLKRIIKILDARLEQLRKEEAEAEQQNLTS